MHPALLHSGLVILSRKAHPAEQQRLAIAHANQLRGVKLVSIVQLAETTLDVEGVAVQLAHQVAALVGRSVVRLPIYFDGFKPLRAKDQDVLRLTSCLISQGHKVWALPHISAR